MYYCIFERNKWRWSCSCLTSRRTCAGVQMSKMKRHVMLLVAMVMTSSTTCRAAKSRPSASAVNLLQYSPILQGNLISRQVKTITIQYTHCRVCSINYPRRLQPVCQSIRNSPFLMSFCLGLRVVPRFGGNVNINKPLAACNGTSTQYMIFSAIYGRVLVLIVFKSFHLISALETWNATLRHICLHYSVLCLRVVTRFRWLMNIR